MPNNIREIAFKVESDFTQAAGSSYRLWQDL